VFLWEVLTRRYPFRLFPALPPKRIGRKLLLLFFSIVAFNAPKKRMNTFWNKEGMGFFHEIESLSFNVPSDGVYSVL